MNCGPADNSTSRRENALPLAGAVDQAFEKSLQLIGRLVAITLNDVGFLSAGQRAKAFRKSLSTVGQVHQHASPVSGILNPIDKRIGNHPIDHLGQSRMIDENGIGEIAHRVTLAVRKDHQDAPLLDRNALLAEPSFKMSIDLAISLSKQIGEMIANGGFPSGSFGHDYDFALRN